MINIITVGALLLFSKLHCSAYQDTLLLAAAYARNIA